MQEPRYPREPGLKDRRDIGGNTESSGFADAPPTAPDLAPGNFAHAALPPGMNWRLTRDLPDTLQVPEEIASYHIENLNSVSEIPKEHQSLTTIALAGMVVGCLMAMAIMYTLRKIRGRDRAVQTEILFRDVEIGENGDMGINGELLAGCKSER
ncbi:hypothetical protein N7G274_003369 [Stereocaulon virgatum]|uniref:Uncharacterized protein n=1 Tax=Stereocaulon virgatum TaxID=373712 RepID=A0ABR4AGL8_9LECA